MIFSIYAFFHTRCILVFGKTLVSWFRFVHRFSSFTGCFDSSCQYQCNWLPGKTCLQNSLLYIS